MSRTLLRAEVFLRRLLLRPRLDLPLLAALLLLAALGLFFLASAADLSWRTIGGQALRFVIGFAVLYTIARVPPTQFRRWTPPLYAASLLLLLLVLVHGEGSGADRWLNLGVVRFQPSELLKLTMPMMVAWYLAQRPLPPSWRDTGAVLLLIALPAVLIAKQPDLGTALLVAMAGAFALFLSGLSLRRIGLMFAVLLALLPVAWHHMHDYQRERVLTLLNPESDPLGTGWHIIQSEIAVGSGGVLGKGFMQGTQAQLQFLPEHTTDFIFAVVGEEFGLVAVLLLLALYLFIIGRSLWIASNARDTYARLLGGALALSFFIYVLVNGGMISGLLPVVGVPLPLVSYGGTSAVSLLAGFGVLMSIHAHRKFMK